MGEGVLCVYVASSNIISSQYIHMLQLHEGDVLMFLLL